MPVRSVVLVTCALLLCGGPSTVFGARMTCKQVSSCEEAVEIWCNGYRRADGDSDGIPCENVCHSIEQVEEIRGRQDC